MLRNGFLAGVGVLAAAILLMIAPNQASAGKDCDINSPYLSGCRSGHCGGGDFYLGGRGRCDQCKCLSYAGVGLRVPGPYVPGQIYDYRGPCAPGMPPQCDQCRWHRPR